MSASNEVPLDQEELKLLLRALGTRKEKARNEMLYEELAAIEDLDAKLWTWRREGGGTGSNEPGQPGSLYR